MFGVCLNPIRFGMVGVMSGMKHLWLDVQEPDFKPQPHEMKVIKPLVKQGLLPTRLIKGEQNVQETTKAAKRS